jgi:lauroyl/myristoyl acyltransferase
MQIAYGLAEAFADCWYLLSAGARRNVKHNLRLVPGLGGADKSTGRLARRIMRNFARVVTEFFYLPRMDRTALKELVDIESFRKLQGLTDGGNAIFVTAHVGNWELAATATVAAGMDLYVVVYDHPDPRVARLFRRYRQSRGLKIISVTDGPVRMRTAVRAGSLGVVADRDFTGRGTEVSFLGSRVRVPSGYAALAISEGVPVIPGFCLKDSDGKYRLSIGEAVFSPGKTSSEITDIVGRYIRLVEKQVEKTPEQWYLFDKLGEES